MLNKLTLQVSVVLFISASLFSSGVMGHSVICFDPHSETKPWQVEASGAQICKACGFHYPNPNEYPIAKDKKCFAVHGPKGNEKTMDCVCGPNPSPLTTH